MLWRFVPCHAPCRRCHRVPRASFPTLLVPHCCAVPCRIPHRALCHATARPQHHTVLCHTSHCAVTPCHATPCAPSCRATSHAATSCCHHMPCATPCCHPIPTYPIPCPTPRCHPVPCATPCCHPIPCHAPHCAVIPCRATCHVVLPSHATHHATSHIVPHALQFPSSLASEATSSPQPPVAPFSFQVIANQFLNLFGFRCALTTSPRSGEFLAAPDPAALKSPRSTRRMSRFLRTANPAGFSQGWERHMAPGHTDSRTHGHTDTHTHSCQARGSSPQAEVNALFPSAVI